MGLPMSLLLTTLHVLLLKYLRVTTLMTPSLPLGAVTTSASTAFVCLLLASSVCMRTISPALIISDGFSLLRSRVSRSLGTISVVKVLWTRPSFLRRDVCTLLIEVAKTGLKLFSSMGLNQLTGAIY